MTSPKTFIEEQLALRADMASRLDMMKRHLSNPGSSGSITIGINFEDVTEETVADLEAKIAEVDERLDRLRHGNV
jgi:hypothetical protein